VLVTRHRRLLRSLFKSAGAQPEDMKYFNNYFIFVSMNIFSIDYKEEP
jgi:hypothetical protein